MYRPLLALALTLFAAPAWAQNTWTTLTARTLRADFPFPQNFEAQRAIALYDTNGNCRVDSYPLGDENATFPFFQTPLSVTLGRHMGSPVRPLPGVENGVITVTPTPGFCGRIVVYAERVDGATTSFLWFAFNDGRATPASYDNATFGLDFGLGSYTQSTDPRLAQQVFHATHVGGYYANNGTADHAGAGPTFFTWTNPAGTLTAPGHVFSADPDPTRGWPAAFGDMVAGILAGDPFQNLFLGITGATIDVPLVAEENWDGQTLFPAALGLGRRIQPLSAAPRSAAQPLAPNPLQSQTMVGDFTGDGRTDIALYRAGWGSTPLYAAANGLFTVTNAANAANFINDPTASRRVGDFNGDGRADVLLFRSGWSTTPVYFSNGNGTFRVTTLPESSGFNLLNDPATGKLLGDFDGDGRTDLALYRAGWNSTPVYLSNGDGTFRFFNYLNPAGMNWINDSGVRRLVGDFNGDGRADVLVSRAGWSSTPVYTASGRGWFTVTNAPSGNAVTNLLNDPMASPMVGDFDRDGRADVALARAGWNSTPVCFSLGNGAFRSTNYLTSTVELNDPSARRIVGDFDGDGRSDIAVLRVGYTTTPVYLSSGVGWFTRAAWNTPGNLLSGAEQVLAGDFNGDRRMDLVPRRRTWTATPTHLALGGGGFQVSLDTHLSGENWINE